MRRAGKRKAEKGAGGGELTYSKLCDKAWTWIASEISKMNARNTFIISEAVD